MTGAATLSVMITRPPCDIGLARQSGCPGPRDASYPAAPSVREDLGGEQLRRWAWRSNLQPSPRPISLYVHIPYCFCPCFYCGSGHDAHGASRQPAAGERYLERILQELRLTAPLFDNRREVIQLHFGGGPANFLDPQQLSRALAAVAGGFHLSRKAERDFSIVLDPRHIREGDIALLAQLGFNRVSLGVHDFDARVQQAMNRVHDVAETLAVIDACRRNAFRSVNIDLVYGLPLQTLAGFSRTLDTVIGARPERVAIQGYAHAPARLREEPGAATGKFAGPEERLALLRLALERLGAAGYRHVGLDQFALPDDDLVCGTFNGHMDRTFIPHLTHAKSDLVGLGPSAISHIGNSITQNHRALPEWEAALDQNLLPVAHGLVV